eukprot:CAMPEP_0202896142 /NCGR_PEP_ID=MMETSP1392-20130828/5192_1 /ASSEMBLY_ACC=CAM_ASM_000868 /TAXON_ID=225041 /ORGANISM="Chlamydomonas chlamydogama, Strain SAG 11-48b" /LENGTH=91 /DNA_ID=CAMNT_0049581383 /DNA_START=147 /DNA_END=419 /DNA_ORIENTATION=-
MNDDKAASLQKLLKSKPWSSEEGLQFVMRYLNRLVEKGWVTERALRATEVEQLMDAGLSLGAASLLKSKFPSYRVLPIWPAAQVRSASERE